MKNNDNFVIGIILVVLFVASIALDFGIMQSEMPEWFKIWWLFSR